MEMTTNKMVVKYTTNMYFCCFSSSNTNENPLYHTEKFDNFSAISAKVGRESGSGWRHSDNNWERVGIFLSNSRASFPEGTMEAT